MPTILTFNGLRACSYPNDYRPAHVHVMGNGSEAVFQLTCPLGPPALRENDGSSGRVLNRIAVELTRQISMLCYEWENIHGND